MCFTSLYDLITARPDALLSLYRTYNDAMRANGCVWRLESRKERMNIINSGWYQPGAKRWLESGHLRISSVLL